MKRTSVFDATDRKVLAQSGIVVACFTVSVLYAVVLTALALRLFLWLVGV